MLPVKKNIGSTLALICGWLAFVAGLTPPYALASAGPIIVIAAYAYRSAKIRWLSKERKMPRLIVELVGMLAILFLWLGQNNLRQSIETDPVPNFIIPLWAIFAYASMFERALRAPAPHTDEVFK